MDAADVLVGDFARQIDFAAEIFLHGLVGGGTGLQNFQGDNFARFEVADFVDDSHSAGANARKNFVAGGNASGDFGVVHFEDVFGRVARAGFEAADPLALKIGIVRYRFVHGAGDQDLAGSGAS